MLARWKEETFEIPEEVRIKIAAQETSARLIAEGELDDLSYIDVRGRAYIIVKRVLDIVLASAAILLLLLPILIVAVAIYLDDPGSVIFKQNRIGRNGKTYKLFKLRTMKLSTPKYLSTREVEDPKHYITRFGRFLRKTSVDEVPQLWNVLKGEMSLVGPRPLISDEFEIHCMRMRFGVYNIRPGITGLAQINGRDTVTPADKVRWDVKYLENFGFKEDVRILFATAAKVLGCEGVVEGGKRTGSVDFYKPSGIENVKKKDSKGEVHGNAAHTPCVGHYAYIQLRKVYCRVNRVCFGTDGAGLGAGDRR